MLVLLFPGQGSQSPGMLLPWLDVPGAAADLATWSEAIGADLLETCAAFLETGGSIEATARNLYVHANTVRYRLRKVLELVGLDLTSPRDAQVVRVAFVIGRTQDL